MLKAFGRGFDSRHLHHSLFSHRDAGNAGAPPVIEVTPWTSEYLKQRKKWVAQRPPRLPTFFGLQSEIEDTQE